MATYVSNRDSGGSTDEKGHLKFWSKTLIGNVLNGQEVVASSPLAMSVRVSAGDIRIPYSDYAHMAWSEGYTTVTISTPDPTNPRIDRIVAYIDRSMNFAEEDINNPGALKYMAVAGSPNSSPVAVSNSTIDTAVSGNPWVELARVRVNAGVTQISSSNITDYRTFINLAPEVNATPIGTVVDFAGTTAPNGWLLCYGQAVSRTAYASLFAVLGTIHGPGDNTTTFNLPDLRGRVVAGQDDMGGSSADRLTGSSGGVNGDTLGAVGGSENHVLLPTQLPSTGIGINDPGHAHGVSDPGHNHGLYQDLVSTSGGGNQRTYLGGGSGQQLKWSASNIAPSGSNIGIYGSGTGITISNSGANVPHNNVQPTAILNKIIKF